MGGWWRGGFGGSGGGRRRSAGVSAAWLGGVPPPPGVWTLQVCIWNILCDRRTLVRYTVLDHTKGGHRGRERQARDSRGCTWSCRGGVGGSTACRSPHAGSRRRRRRKETEEVTYDKWRYRRGHTQKGGHA